MVHSNLQRCDGDPGIANKSRPTTFEVCFGRAALPASCGSWPSDWHQSCSDWLIAGNGPLLGLYWHRPGHKGAKALAQASTSIGNAGGLGDAIRMARVLEAAHFDAVHALRHAKSLRLVVLKDDLAVIVAASPEVGETFDLALAPGEAPRLRIDLITAVVMEPGPKTYRLVEDAHGSREILLESADRADMVDRMKQHMARRIIAKERHKAVPGHRPGNVPFWMGGRLHRSSRPVEPASWSSNGAFAINPSESLGISFAWRLQHRLEIFGRLSCP